MKLFEVEELPARMRAALRHANRPVGDAAEPVSAFGNVTVDLGRKQVCVSGAEVHLTPIEH